MIVRENPNLFKLLFIKQGSIVPLIKYELFFIVLIASITTAYDYSFGHLIKPINLTIFTMFGLALSLFLGFRNNTAYDRWWEGRNIWSRLVMETRCLARSIRAVLKKPEHIPIIKRLDSLIIAFPVALRHQCQKTRMDDDIKIHLLQEDYEYILDKVNPANIIVLRISEILSNLMNQGEISDVNFMMLDERLNKMALILAGCERLNKTPIPFAYNLLVKKTALLYCILVPLGLVAYIGLATPIITLFIAYTFFGFDALSSELEDPFTTRQNGLPLHSMCIGIERSIKDMQGKSGDDIPRLPRIKNYILR